MFLIPEGDQTFAIKPMNCPGHMVLFANTLRSYRELPLRYAEAAPLHRNERAGTLHGLTRVRHVTQDDAHIFCTREQIEDEIFGCLDYAMYLYDLFGLDASFELTRPENVRDDEEWTSPRGWRPAALERRGPRTRQRGRHVALRAEDHPTCTTLGRAAADGHVSLTPAAERLNCRYIGPTTPARRVSPRAEGIRAVRGILTEHYAAPSCSDQVCADPDPPGRRDHREPRGAAGAGALPGRGGRLRRPSASGSGTPRSRSSCSSSSTGTRNDEAPGGERGGQSTLAPDFGKTCYPEPWRRGGTRLSPPAHASGFNRMLSRAG